MMLDYDIVDSRRFLTRFLFRRSGLYLQACATDEVGRGGVPLASNMPCASCALYRSLRRHLLIGPTIINSSAISSGFSTAVELYW